jgi:hypothetical protein
MARRPSRAGSRELGRSSRALALKRIIPLRHRIDCGTSTMPYRLGLLCLFPDYRDQF